MQSEISLVFPHQLFMPNPCLQPLRPVWMVEEFLFFRQYQFHKLKLMFHRASMQSYRKAIAQQGYTVFYVASDSHECQVSQLVEKLASDGVRLIHYCDPVDNWLHLRLRKSADKHNVKLICYESPAFIHSDASIRQALGNKKRYFQTEFYTSERRRLGVLVDGAGRPLGGKWSFDSENRKPWPKGKSAPPVQWPDETDEVREARLWVKQHFPENPGEVPERFFYPINHHDASAWLNQFIEKRLLGFGPYEDAVVGRELLLNHSLLSPLLNVGLLNPYDAVDAAVKAYQLRMADLASAEGFIRQIIGWREFIRGVYVIKGTYERNKNHFSCHNPIPQAFYNATTGIKPVDQTIRKVLNTAYNHHIERLMILGNFMLLCEIHPDEVYRWFMELYIDAYDWVMVPNVYGMSQFADGGMMSTKPYISGSRYLLSMTDFNKGSWTETWDALFWRFIHIHRKKLTINPRIGMLVSGFDRMLPEKRNALLERAEHYLNQLHSGELSIINDK